MTKELHVRCDLYLDLQNGGCEGKEHALDRLIRALMENDIAISINSSEIRNVEE